MDRACVEVGSMTPAETARRAFRQLYQYAPDLDCPVDQHRLAFLVRVVTAIEAAGLAVVEMEDGR
jgi:hypothetical protein